MLLCIYGVFDKLQFPKYFWSTQGRQVMLGLGLSSATYRLLFAAQHIWAGLLSIITFRFTFLHSLQKLFPRFFPTFNPQPTSPMHASPPRCLKWSSRGFRLLGDLQLELHEHQSGHQRLEFQPKSAALKSSAPFVGI